MRVLVPICIAVFLFAPAIALAADGKALFAKNCAGCHGADAKATTPAAKAMKVPAIASHEAVGTIAAVKTKPQHKPIAGQLSDDELKAIAEHLAAL